jgi:hypothetical protein
MEPHVHEQDKEADARDVTECARHHDEEANANSDNSTTIVASPVASESMQQTARVVSAFGMSPAFAVFLHEILQLHPFEKSTCSSLALSASKSTNIKADVR